MAQYALTLPKLLNELAGGAGVAVLTDEAVRSADVTDLAAWVGLQSTVVGFSLRASDRTRRRIGKKSPTAEKRQMEILGNVAFLERPFHPTTFISVVKTALRGRRRQYEARARLSNPYVRVRVHARHAEIELRGLNETPGS